MLPRRVLTALAAIACLVVAGCTSDPSSPPSSAAPATSGSRSAQAPTSAAQTYVSVGDSYAAGYQPSGDGPGRTTRNGFAYQAVTAAKARGYDLTLVNFGCSGATTTSALSTPGCRERNLGPGAPSYSSPQITAAADYLRAHRGKVGLVSIVLGGNDITGCVDSTTTSEATTCVTNTLTKITANLTTIARQLRAAAGPGVRIVGLTYPDVFLGESLSRDPERRQLADLSTFAFSSLINPQLQAAYAKAGATFADVTTATGAFTPTTQTTTLAPYGTIPVAVARVCALTYYCERGDIHPRTAGYKIIADLVAGQLPRR